MNHSPQRNKTFFVRGFLPLGIVLGLVMFAHSALAFNYPGGGYKWAGSFPNVTVDYSGVGLNAWRVRIQNTMNDWNATGAKFKFVSGSSNNDILVTSCVECRELMTSPITRQYGFTGPIVKAKTYINVAKQWSPPDSAQYAYDFSSVMRHEQGHWLRLDHVSSGLMEGNFGWGEVQYVDSDARSGIRHIYGVQ